MTAVLDKSKNNVEDTSGQSGRSEGPHIACGRGCRAMRYSHSVCGRVATERDEPEAELLHRVLDLVARSLVESEALGERRRGGGNMGEGGVKGIDELDGS